MIYQYEPLGEEYLFQTFLKDLFNAIYSTQTFEEYGSKGHTQYGVDVYCPHFKIAIQAKKKDINRKQEDVIKELLSDLSISLKKIKDFPHPVEKLFFATTTKSLIKLQNACIDASVTEGINVTFFSWNDIQLRLSDYPSVRNKYFPHLKEALTESETSLNQSIKRLEELIAKLDKKDSNSKKQYREIPYCEILLPNMEQEFQTRLIVIIMKISLFQTFKGTKYKNFKGLFNFGKSYTQYSDGTSGPGFEIICGEVVFLANCTRLVKSLQDNHNHFWNEVDKYNADTNFNKIKFRMELLPFEGLTAYEFEIDEQTGYYHIRVNKYDDLEYHKLDSLSTVLPFIAHATKPTINVIDFDKIENHSAFMKLFLSLLKENTFRRNLLKVNVDDFEDWDYDYHPSSDD